MCYRYFESSYCYDNRSTATQNCFVRTAGVNLHTVHTRSTVTLAASAIKMPVSRCVARYYCLARGTGSMLLASLEAGEQTQLTEKSWMPTRSVWYRFVPTTSGTATFGSTDPYEHHVNVYLDKNGTLAGLSLVSQYGRGSVTASKSYVVQVLRAPEWWGVYPLDSTVTVNWAVGGM